LPAFRAAPRKRPDRISIAAQGETASQMIAWQSRKGQLDPPDRLEGMDDGACREIAELSPPTTCFRGHDEAISHSCASGNLVIIA